MRKDTWQCAGWSRELATGPIGRKLLERYVVLFRDASGAAHALGARCPHRGADLGQGAVIDGCIRCPLHGWRFDSLGHCVQVPSQPRSVKIPPLAHVPVFPLQEEEGTLWIWMDDRAAPNTEPSPPAAKPRTGEVVRRLFFDGQLVNSPFLDLLENFFDKAHTPFIHRGTFGPDQDPLVTRQRITVDAEGCGLQAEDDPNSQWRARPKVPGGWLGWLGRMLLGLRAPSAEETRFDVRGGAQIYLEYPNGTYDRFVTHLTPADATHTWLFVESVRTRAPHAIGDWIQRRALQRIFREGQRETSLILPAGPDDLARQVSVESDRLGLAARRLYERWAASSNVNTPAGDLATC